MKKKNYIGELLIALMVLSTVATVRGLFVYDEAYNKIFYVVTLLCAVSALFSATCIITLVGSVLWQMTLPYLITWPGALVTIGIYWYLFSKKRIVPISTDIPDKEINGLIFQCTLRTSWGIPIPWRKFQIRRTAGILKVYQTNLFSRVNNAQNIASLCDPELEGNLFPHMFFGTSVLVLKEHTSKEDRLWKKVTLANRDARFLAGEKDDEGFFDKLVRQARVEKKKDEGGLYIN